jgi:pimeloyl-ACP methyl ester carboxylesterase
MSAWRFGSSVIFALMICAPASGQSTGALQGQGSRGAVEGMQAIQVNGVELHYVVRGTGEPIVFVHGSLSDYREWAPVIGDLSSTYRTIAYSRRYNYPNDNAIRGDSHSALVEAEDLKELISKVGTGPVHVAGISYGALTALLLAMDHPELVRTLTIVEPPLIRWLPELPGGKAEYDRIISQLIAPAAAAFRAGHREQALHVTMDFFAGPDAMDQFPEEMLRALRSNLREWEAIMTSRDGFPLVAREDVRRLKVPVLMISGERTYSFLRITDTELERLLPDVDRTIVENATHEVCSEQPGACAAAIRKHLSKKWQL